MMPAVVSSTNKITNYLVVFIMCCSLCAIYYSARFVVADIQAYKARYQLSKWEEKAMLPSVEEVEYSLEMIDSALRWAPKDTEYIDLKAHLLTYKGLLYWQQQSFVEITAEALKLYRQSTQLRSNWPYAWARLALVKAYRGEVDEEFALSLVKASKYGPWEPNVQNTLLEAGMLSWHQLDKITRNNLLLVIQRSLVHQKIKTKNLIERHGLTLPVCGYLPINNKSRWLCDW